MVSPGRKLPTTSWRRRRAYFGRHHLILVVANGADKADIVRRAFFGPVTPEVPASILQFHPNVTVVVDKEAAALCQ